MLQFSKILANKIDSNHELIETWFAKKFSESKPLFYNSVDLRHSNFKIAPVDTNCFPAGFNNLSANSRGKAQKTVEDFFISNFPDTKKVLIVSENHTRNYHYLENLLTLSSIISNNKRIEVIIGTLIDEVDKTLDIDLPSSQKITLQKITKEKNRITTVNNFNPDLIILNNDLTSGLPTIFLDLEQVVIPSPQLGWYQRAKSTHFESYDKLARELSSLIDLDYWLISTMHRKCSEVNFKEQIGINCLAENVDELITKIRSKYEYYQINAEPYCYIKADNGTYGMAVTTARSGDEIREINKKERNKMDVIKGSVHNSRIIIQEGVKTFDQINDTVAEPMIYLINGLVIGNLFRANNQRNQTNSLNTQGMTFYDLEDLDDSQLSIGLAKNKMIKIYSLVARLSALAASREEY